MGRCLVMIAEPDGGSAEQMETALSEQRLLTRVLDGRIALVKDDEREQDATSA